MKPSPVSHFTRLFDIVTYNIVKKYAWLHTEKMKCDSKVAFGRKQMVHNRMKQVVTGQ